MVGLPRLVVAAPGSGHGKTTMATGLMAALRQAGHTVSGHKIGPDYIDTGYHSLATGRPGRNLDAHLVGEERLIPLLLHGAAGADLAVIEGVMGLYDGQIGGDGYASTAHVAALTDTPVLLVVDISHTSRSIAALVHGLQTWPGRHWPGHDRRARIGGIVLNKSGSPRHTEEVIRALESSGVADTAPILGVLPRDAGVEAPSRHLGLVPAAERDNAVAAIDRLAGQVAAHVDLDGVLALAGQAPALEEAAWDPAAELVTACSAIRTLPPTPPPSHTELDDPTSLERPVIAMAGGRAFTFTYAETVELLEAAGCAVVTFDPTADTALPPGTRGLYLGGGFPEMHAGDLGGNESLRQQIRAAVAQGLPTVAECAGLLYLCSEVTGPDGQPNPMTGTLPYDAVMAPRLTLSYREATAPADNLLCPAGTTVKGHEFHRTALVPALGEETPAPGPAWTWSSAGRRSHPVPEGFATATLHASYLHTHWAGMPELAARFAQAVIEAEPATEPVGQDDRTRLRMPAVGADGVMGADGADGSGAGGSGGAVGGAGARMDLRHHGDKEAVAGFVDFAVNVHDSPRPGWLDEALDEALDQLHRYPDPRYAEEAIAARHGRTPPEVLATAGAAEAFGLLARMRRWRRPTVVHPQFTEPEVALQVAGYQPYRVVLSARDDFALDPGQVPPDADLLFVGNPTNPTGVLHDLDTLAALRRPGRTLVVDEAFCDEDAVSWAQTAHDPGEGEVVVLRSLTKLWSLPGLRIGYALSDPALIAELRAQQTPWSVSTPAAAAAVACSSLHAQRETEFRMWRLVSHRTYLQEELARIGVRAVPSRAAFVLARPGLGVHTTLRAEGIAVRRCDTFPGLDGSWIRIAVRDRAATDRLIARIQAIRSLHPVGSSRGGEDRD